MVKLEDYLLSPKYKSNIKLQCEKNEASTGKKDPSCEKNIASKCDARIVGEYAALIGNVINPPTEAEKQKKMKKAAKDARIDCGKELKDCPMDGTPCTPAPATTPSTTPQTNNSNPAPSPASGSGGSKEPDYSKGFLTQKDLKKVLVYSVHKNGIKKQCQDDYANKKTKDSVSECEKKKQANCDDPIINQNNANMQDLKSTIDEKTKKLKQVIANAEIVCESQITDPKYSPHPTQGPGKSGSSSSGSSGSQPSPPKSKTERIKAAIEMAKTAVASAEEAESQAATAATDAKTESEKTDAADPEAAKAAAAEAAKQQKIAETAVKAAKKEAKKVSNEKNADNAEKEASKVEAEAAKAIAAAGEAVNQLAIAKAAANPLPDKPDDPDPPSNSNDPDQKKTSHLLLYIVAFVILAAVGGALVYVALKNKPQTTMTSPMANIKNPFSKK